MSSQTVSIDEKIEGCRQELCHCPSWSLDRLRLVFTLSCALFSRFQQLGGMEFLEESISSFRQGINAIDNCPIWKPYRFSFLNNLGTAVSTRFQQLRRIEDLEEAITCHRESLALNQGHANRAASLTNLGIVVTIRFEQLGRVEDLEEAITCHREALTLLPQGHPNRAASLAGLGNSVFFRFRQSGRIEDLEEAITSHRGALALLPQGHLHHLISLSNLANYLNTRFAQSGRIEDLEEAITYHREALALRPRGHPDRPSSLCGVGTVVFSRFEQSGNIKNLEEAIACDREAIALFPQGHPDRPTSLSNLGNHVAARFELSGSMEDLEEAITCHREALAHRPHGHSTRSVSVTGLANSLSTRFQRSGRREDLEEAIALHREALALRPHGHHDRSGSLNNLANSVFTRFKLLGGKKDLEEAITYYREALTLYPQGHPDRARASRNLGVAVITRFGQSGSKDDLLDAHKYLSEAKTILPTDHPSHATTGRDLALMLLKTCDVIPKSDETLTMTSQAFGLYEQAANHSFASAKARFQAAVHWAREARHRKHQSTVDAYAKSLSLLDRCLVLAPTVESQQHFLAATNTVPKELALDAASSAIDAGELGTAVEFLEQGRAILWSKLRGYRHPLDELRAIDEKLADQFKTLSGQLECLATSSESQLTEFSGSNGVKSFEAKMQLHRMLSEEWDDIVGKIRQIDGFADFLQGVPFATLQRAAAEGPVIIVNISRYRSDAIILRDDGDPVLVPLPETLPGVLNQLSSEFTRACASNGKDSARQILPILRSLWDNIAFPVRVQLVALGVPDKSRIWWCPTSDLCALPLHAAGAYSSKVAKPDNLPDCYISSYTPTLSALITARSGILPRSTDPNLLVIAQPDETLPEVEEEVSRIRRLTNNVDILKGPEANHDTVLSNLRNHSWAHFACHGHLNNQPFHSSFQMHNHSRLALVDLIGARLVDAELAFLSACHTAAGDMVGTPDEVIHLAAAMQFCGFRSVVGTLWALEDVDGRDATEDFYQHMFRTAEAIPNFRDSAEALNLATRNMRKRKLGLDRWVKFVHIGA